MNIPYGTYNIGSDKKISKLDFIKLIATFFDYRDSRIVNINYTNNGATVRRPLNTFLDCSKVKSYLNKYDLSIDKSFNMLKSEIQLK